MALPYDGPYSTWEDSATAAFGFRGISNLLVLLELDKDPNDLVCIATFAEVWNGRGYFNKDKPSPYVFSGTSAYLTGKYVSDGNYDVTAVDRQIGVVPMIVKLLGEPELR